MSFRKINASNVGGHCHAPEESSEDLTAHVSHELFGTYDYMSLVDPWLRGSRNDTFIIELPWWLTGEARGNINWLAERAVQRGATVVLK